MIKRVLLTNDFRNDFTGGVTTFMDDLQQGLEERGLEVKILSPEDFPRSPIKLYDKKVRLAMPTPSVYREAFKSFRPDAVHIVTEGSIGLGMRTYCRLTQTPFTTAYHTHIDRFFAARVATQMQSLTEEFIGKALVRFHNRSSNVLVGTEHLAKELKDRGLKPNCHILPQSVDAGKFTPGGKTLFLDRDGPVSLYVGRVSQEKNIEAFLDIPTESGTKVIVGDGPYLETLKAKYDNDRNIIFAGEQRGQALIEYYRSADVFVFPSKFDTFGIVLLEAASTGLPIVAYPMAAAPALTQDDRFGACHDNLPVAFKEVVASLKTRDSNTKIAMNTAMLEYSQKKTVDAFIEGQVPSRGNAMSAPRI